MNLPPGVYSVTAKQAGFKKEGRYDIVLTVNSSGRVDLTLQTGNGSETIEVTAAPALL